MEEIFRKMSNRVANLTASVLPFIYTFHGLKTCGDGESHWMRHMKGGSYEDDVIAVNALNVSESET
jgi:hypothetical protein